MRVLDVGCGSGRLLSELKGKRIEYVGIDFSSTLIEVAKKQFPQRKFLLRDIATVEGWKRLGQFDAVFCLGVLHHLPDREYQHDLLQQMFLHTKANGFLVISVWNLWQFRFWKYHLRQIIKKVEYWNPSFVWIPYSVSNGKKVIKRVERFCKAFLAGELISLVKQVGYQVETFFYAAKGKTHLSIFRGENFCLLARKR
ncbi:hypothetical protein A2160_01520 [Candidatus Beckwithbacteria bacterium RBG_13_42_9]|uniref:Methyltransferase domain-containing protein n=1 Tax=Candidatus Beckwithbacteria bacterium RBG_13_42_9 TaxID=1797457 RepID=A0A1F5E8Z7_9BACT|nr:MAG: hypothetical protein A2160_01520 [Candidatus Beckwithbacteria bacterium RBG_13_42_9]